MKLALALAAGVVVGLVAAGAVAATMMSTLPEPLHSQPVVLGTAAAIVIVSAYASWRISSPRR